MKVRVTMKTPDAMDEAISCAVCMEIDKVQGLSCDEKDELLMSRSVDARNIARQWFQYNEYVIIELDTEAGTATVVPVGK